MNQIKVGAILSYIAIFINIITGIVYTPWMINSIGKENFGLYTLAMSVISLFVLDFGLSSAVTRFISNYLAEGRQDKADKCLGLVYRLYILLDIFFVLLLFCIYFLIPTLYKELTLDELQRFKIIFVMVAVYSVISFPFIPTNGILTAHEKFIPLKLISLFHKISIAAIMSCCLLMGGGLYSLVLINIIVGILEIVFKLIYISKKTNQKIDYNYFDFSEFKKIISYSGWITVIALAQRCIFTIAPTILGALSGSVAIAILGISITLESYTNIFANAINGMFLPKVSRIYSNNDGNILPLMIKVGRIQVMTISIVVIGFICLGQDFINLWVGEQFNDSYICTVLIILPSLFQLPQEIGIQAIAVKNKVKYEAYVFILMALLNILGSIILGKFYGAVGICISIFISYIVRTIGIDCVLKKYLFLEIGSFIKETFVKFFIPIILSLLCGYIITNIIALQGWLGFIIKGLSFAFSHTFLLYVLGMNSYEKELLFSPIKKILRK